MFAKSILSVFSFTLGVSVAFATHIPLADLFNSGLDRNGITTIGTVVETFRDEIDPGWDILLLKDGATFLPVSFRHKDDLNPNIWLDCTVKIKGSCCRGAGETRAFVGPLFLPSTPISENITVISRPSTNNAEYPLLDQSHVIDPKDIARLDQHIVSGLVLARWNGDTCALRTDDGNTISVTLRNGLVPPPPGQRICAIGYPTTDLYQINLTRANIKSTSCVTNTCASPPMPVEIRQLYFDKYGRPRIEYKRFNGQNITVRGRVRQISADRFCKTIILGQDNLSIPVFVDSDAGILAPEITNDAIIEATGICILECENWNPNLVVPRIKSRRLFVRKVGDIRILARAPWWTPARLAVIIGALLAVIAGFAAWSTALRRIVHRRSRELLKEQIARVTADLRTDERTRLAVELHDALSQNLEGVAFQVAASRDLMTASPETAKQALDAASHMLLSSRTELKRCLFDLRHDALEAKSFNEALRTTLEPISGNATLTIRFNVRRDIFSDTSAHIVLCIIRELVSNAVRHGSAKHVRIAGEFHDGTLNFSIRDDGSGFDTVHYPGPGNGHFGLEGIRERVHRLNGVFSIESKPGGPTRATVTATLSSPFSTATSTSR